MILLSGLDNSGETEMPVRKTSRGYKIDNVSGYSSTREEALKKMKAIKANKQHKRRKDKDDY